MLRGAAHDPKLPIASNYSLSLAKTRTARGISPERVEHNDMASRRPIHDHRPPIPEVLIELACVKIERQRGDRWPLLGESGRASQLIAS